MTNNFKFIHAADIHLGSNLHIRQNLNKDLVKIVDNAVYDSLERIFNIAAAEKVNFILLSGDIYDRDSRSIKANSFFVKQCLKLKDENIDVFIIGGNHDPVKENSEYFKLPSNVHIFSAEKAEIFELKDNKQNVYCKVIGQSYRDTSDSRKIFENYKLSKDNIFTIAMLHTQLDKSNNYIPCTFTDLKAIENIDYWALGHIHKPQVINGQAPYAIYPGIPQGRDSGEEGIGGAVLIEAADNNINAIKFIKTSPIIWENMNINIKNFNVKNLSDLENVIINNLEDLTNSEKDKLSGIDCLYLERWSLTKGYIINLNIEGRGEIYEHINEKEEEAEEALIENLNIKLLKKNPFIYVNSIEFYVGKPIEAYEELLNDNEMIKSINLVSNKCLEDEAFKDPLSKKLGAIWEESKDKEDLNIKKLQLDEETYKAIISRAKQLIIDLLLERGEE
ncbi:metallophosphoesterase family protein [Candidatus Clostridium radicumherbarum]|uniref:Exonuclease SbcCD subunit D n=1 Tax=Candidatus Clostridium radicumherbarum TaxID=3381662 RepID=A0ABW8TXN4_9CLOT